MAGKTVFLNGSSIGEPAFIFKIQNCTDEAAAQAAVNILIGKLKAKGKISAGNSFANVDDLTKYANTL